MGFRAGRKNENDADVEGAAGKRTKPKRGIFLILVGLVITGIAAGWAWLRRLPKD
jgi:hypothetical protein